MAYSSDSPFDDPAVLAAAGGAEPPENPFDSSSNFPGADETYNDVGGSSNEAYGGSNNNNSYGGDDNNSDAFPGESEWSSAQFPGASEYQPAPPSDRPPAPSIKPPSVSQTQEMRPVKENVKCACLLRCFRCFGVPVHISFWYVIYVVVEILNCFRTTHWFYVICTILLSLPVQMCALLCFGGLQTILNKMLGGYSTCIVLLPWTGQAEVFHDKKVFGEFVLSFGSSLALVPFAVASAFISIATNPGSGKDFHFVDRSEFGYNYITLVFWIMIILIIVNTFVPAYPLNGSKIFAVTIYKCAGLEKTAKIIVMLGCLIALPTLIISVVQGIYLLPASISLNVLYESWKLYKHVNKGTLHLHSLFQHFKANQQESGHHQLQEINEVALQ